ncbi:MAG TPA: HD-GYP domain-containing protein [Candidatus Limnocylindria bacterium]|nr:HD-GYP domain-containing protein [Candidatus Limnocylindria bacterium]
MVAPVASVAKGVRGLTVGGAGTLLLAGVVFAWLLAHPASDPSFDVPYQHFAIVTVVSALAFALALMLAIAAVQIAQYRVLFLALGFMAMGGIFAVHGITTPGILKTGQAAGYAAAVKGISAYLSLFVPALLFAASYTGLTATFERRLPFFPAGWLIVALATALGLYMALAVAGTQLLAELPFGTKPYSYVLASVTCALLIFAAVRQAGAFFVSRIPLQAMLAIVFLLLVEAQVEMVLGKAWTLAWWQYHVSMLVAVGLAVWVLNLQRAHGQSLRSILEHTLELQVKVGAELDHAETIAGLVAAIEARDENTKGHNMRVAELAVAIGRKLGLPTNRLRVLARAGMLHDVGKIGIPDAVLNKPGPLDAAEWVTIKRHPELGVEILHGLPTLQQESEIVAAHHERIDGSGYPRGLHGTEIPIEARIVAVADTYDVLISDRPYRKARTRQESITILREECGTRLDGSVVEALLQILGEASQGKSQSAAA